MSSAAAKDDEAEQRMDDLESQVSLTAAAGFNLCSSQDYGKCLASNLRITLGSLLPLCNNGQRLAGLCGHQLQVHVREPFSLLPRPIWIKA